MAADTVRDLALDADGDFEVSGGDLQLVAGAEAVLQAIRIRLQFFKGEWFLDEDAGVPFFQSVLVKSPDANVLQAVFRTAILETPGVEALPSLTLTFDRAARRLSVAFRVSTDLGELDSTVEL
jgi:hypothetical protein